MSNYIQNLGFNDFMIRMTLCLSIQLRTQFISSLKIDIILLNVLSIAEAR